MIRDPSDGSTKEKVEVAVPASGLPFDKHKAAELARLERSREWLKKFQQKAATDVANDQGIFNETKEPGV